MTATDMGKLMAGREGAVAALLADEGAAGFFASCWSHSDYVWDIKHETP